MITSSATLGLQKLCFLCALMQSRKKIAF